MFFVGVILGLCFVTPLVVLYALLVRWCDRFEPEPWWLLIGAFLWGAIFATLGGGISSGVGEALASNMTGAAQDDPGIQAFGATVLAPVFEEGFKGIGVALVAGISALGLREFDGPLDGAIYGGIIGLGFTLTEDILYVAGQFAESGLGGFVGLFFVRTVLLGLSHCTFTACTGLGFGIAAESRNLFVKIVAPIGGYIAAVGMHAFHNGLPTFFGGEGAVLMILCTWVIVMLFFVLLGALVVRDRAIVIRELTGELGGLIHPSELALISTYVTLGWRNWAILFSMGWSAFRQRRHKQLALVELAFIKNRRRRGERGKGLDLKEARLRQEVYLANQRGIWIGN
ncbi:PrsW family intramembrane metalloprotease [Pendulispora albinea]|uniref:PrsW family intramembrane metalloprotease n=1 Tax=Pendulispora albinea TaxID=2741071 RepID=A0ABZ2LSE4_9BACT